MTNQEKNIVPAFTKVKPSVRKKLEEIAAKKEWTLSHIIRYYVEKGVETESKAA